ncbi:hypothetical protein ACN42_g624 [Penicillium freii]|uniref:Uncharacterized protein n=1 Tax=Penicillium freii TaxID=48697 RepID=A0A117NS36_PENFR|nr:hypothetical protein ACN42_g624 [Penicillium freii]
MPRSSWAARSSTRCASTVTLAILCSCHVMHYIYQSLDYLSITLRYSGLFGLVCNSPVQGQVITVHRRKRSANICIRKKYVSSQCRRLECQKYQKIVTAYGVLVVGRGEARHGRQVSPYFVCLSGIDGTI